MKRMRSGSNAEADAKWGAVGSGYVRLVLASYCSLFMSTSAAAP